MADIHPHPTPATPDAPPPVAPPAPPTAPPPTEGSVHEENRPLGKRRKPRWGRRLLIGFVVLLLLGGLLVALAPMLLSTGPGNRLLLGLVNDRIRGHLVADSIDLGWTGQSAQGVKLYGEDRALIANVRAFNAPGVGLIGLATGSGDYGEVTADITKVAAAHNEAGELNVAQALSSPDPSPPTQDEGGGLPEDFSLNLTLNIDQLTFTEPGEAAVVVKDFKLGVDAPNPQDITVRDVQGSVSSGDDAGAIAIESLRLQDAFASDGSLATSTMQVGGEGKVTDIPTGLLGFVTDQVAILQALIGPSFTAAFDGGGGARDASGTVSFVSRNITLDAKLAAAGDAVTLVETQGPEAKVTLTREAYALLTAGEEGKPPAYELAEDVTFVADIERLTMPRTAASVDWQRAAITLRGRADALTLVRTAAADPATTSQGEASGGIERIAMRDAVLLVESDNLGRAVKATITGTAEVDGTVKPVSLTVAASNLFPGEASDAEKPSPRAFQVASQDFPVPLIDAAGGLDGLATAGLGATASMNATLIEASEAEAGRGVMYQLLVYELDSPGLKLEQPSKANQAAAKVAVLGSAEGGFRGVHVRDATAAAFKLDREAAAKFQGDEPTFTVVEPLRGRVQIDSLTWVLPKAGATEGAAGGDAAQGEAGTAMVNAVESSADVTLAVQSGAIRLDQEVAGREAGTLIDVRGLDLKLDSEKNLAAGLRWMLDLQFIERSGEGDGGGRTRRGHQPLAERGGACRHRAGRWHADRPVHRGGCVAGGGGGGDGRPRPGERAGHAGVGVDGSARGRCPHRSGRGRPGQAGLPDG